MWGNREGWAIAAVLAVLIGIGVWQLAGVNRLTPPTKLTAELRQAIGVDPAVDGIVPRKSDAAPGHAGELYLRAVAAVAREPGRYDALETTDESLAIEHSPAGILVLEAASQTGGAILATDPAASVNYRTSPEALEALLLLGRCFSRSALLRLESDTSGSKRALEAQYALGDALFVERIRYVEADAGVSIMRDALAGLQALARKANDADAVGRLDAAERSLGGVVDHNLRPGWEAIGAIDPGTVAKHAGDVDALADRATAEKLWRVEAILALGRHRFNVERLADQLAVPRRLRELATGENDPVILAALDAATKLTVEQFRTLR